MRAYFEVMNLVGLITVAIPYGDWLRVKNWFATGYCKKHLTIIHYSIVVKRNETIEIMLVTTANCLEASVVGSTKQNAQIAAYCDDWFQIEKNLSHILF